MAILLIQALSVIVFTGINAARIVFSLYGLQLGASAASIGAIMAMLYVFPMLLSWPIGVLSDRYPAAWLLGGGIAAGAVGMAVPFFLPALPSLYAASLLLGLSMAFFSVMGQALIGALSKPADRTRNFSNFTLTGSISIFIGPLLAGFSIDHIGYGRTSAGISVLLLLGVAALVAWGGTLPRNETKVPTSGNLLHTLADRRLWAMLAISGLSQLGNDIFLVFVPVYAHGVGLSASAIGMMLAVLAAGSFGVRFGMVHLIARMGDGRLLAIAFFVGACTFALLPLFSGIVPLTLLAFAFGLCQGCTQPLTMMMMFNGAEEGRAGEAIGLRMTTNNAARLVGPMVFGVLASATGLLAVFWITASLMAAGGRMATHAAKRLAR